MKIIVLISFLIVPISLHSQGFKKTFFTILDEFIDREPITKGFDKDNVLVLISVKKEDEKIENDFVISLLMYKFEDYPLIDSLKTYKGVKMVVKFPKEKNELFKYFTSIKDIRKKEEDELTTFFRSYCNYVFQINKNNEIYFMITNAHDDEYYYKKLKKKKVKFSKDLKFTKDM